MRAPPLIEKTMIETVRRALRAETERRVAVLGVTAAKLIEEVRPDVVKLMATGATAEDVIVLLGQVGVTVTKTTLRSGLRRPRNGPAAKAMER